MTVTDSDRILAAGAPIKLAGGEARLRFDLRALKKLEDHFGSLGSAAGRLTAIHASALQALEQPILDDLSVFIAAGVTEPRLQPGDVIDHLDTSEGIRSAMLEATTACINAWIEAFPAPRAEGNEPTAATDNNGSGGASSTGSPPASQDAPTSSSGG